MARYTQEHYEDVARILQEHELNTDIWLEGDPSHDCIARRFADLFAADNPQVCMRCRTPRTQARRGVGCRYADEHHKWSGGFGRARFLAACGLESEG